MIFTIFLFFSTELLKEGYKNKNKKLSDFDIRDPIGADKMGKKIKGEQIILLDEGKHNGVITDVQFIEDPYAYTHIIIKEQKTELELRLGVPTKITENTALGSIIKRFTGKEIKVGHDYDIEVILKDEKVTFISINEDTERGTFTKIKAKSLKPVNEK